MPSVGFTEWRDACTTLYERPDGHRFFSMLGPDEYGGAGPSGYVASFRYEHDESWTRLDEIQDRDRRRADIQGFVSNRLLTTSEPPGR